MKPDEGSDERNVWNAKYAQGSHGSMEPDPFLVDVYGRFLQPVPPGRALDIAGGTGRNAIWLAQRGWNVKLIDVSEVALELARKNARAALQPSTAAEHGSVVTERLDLALVQGLGEENYDLVMVFYYLRRELFPAIIRALKSGGFLLYKTYTSEQARLGSGPSNPDYLLRAGELREAFGSMKVRHYSETVAAKATAEIFARKA